MNSRKKRNLSIICAVVLCASVVIGGTLAYFFDEKDVTNEFTTAGNDDPTEGVEIDLDEPGYNPDESKDMYPGDTIIKDPTITNDKGEVYARVIVRLVDKDSGAVITDTARINQILKILFYDSAYAAGSTAKIDTSTSYTSAQLSALSGVQTPVNTQFTKDSTRGSAGEIYYNYTGTGGKLANAAKVTLFTHAVIPTDWSQTEVDLMGNFNIEIKAQAIQTKNIASASDAYSALDNGGNP